jgi:hypothetical protein
MQRQLVSRTFSVSLSVSASRPRSGVGELWRSPPDARVSSEPISNVRTQIEPRGISAAVVMPPRRFPYQPLDVTLREIRLLTVVSGDESSLIACKIHHASLTTRPAYKALSYVWGSQLSDGEVLVLEGYEVPATKNLIDALRQIRQPTGGESVFLWVDALCINQDDVAERSQQVSIMHEIYSSAERVVIWLGEAGNGSDDAFDSLQAMVELPEEGEQSVDDDHRVSVMRQCSSFFTSLSEQRSWFSRIWILQELALASKDPLVLCGSRRHGLL